MDLPHGTAPVDGQQASAAAETENEAAPSVGVQQSSTRRIPAAESQVPRHSKPPRPSPLSSSFTITSFPDTFRVAPSSTSINYGDGDQEELAARVKRQSRAPNTSRSVSPSRATAMPTWQNWSPDRRQKRGDQATENTADLLQTRRSMDWTTLRRERLANAGAIVADKLAKEKERQQHKKDSDEGTKHKEDEKRQEAKGQEEKKKKKKKAKGHEHDHHGDDDEVSSNSSDSSDSSDTDESDSDVPLLPQHKKKKHKKKHKTHKHKSRRKADGDVEKGYLPIYEERTRDSVPLMEPLAQVLGFIMWQLATFVLGLSLGIFLSGISPGYDVADVGVNSHWWHVDLNKPPFQPPDAILAPVWGATFFLAAVGMWVVWRRGGWKWNKLATTLYLIHLFIFQIWLCLFFFLHELLLAVLTSMIGWAVMLVCVISFCKRSLVGVGLLAPAFVWKSFVVVDVLVIWWMNSTSLAG